MVDALRDQAERLLTTYMEYSTSRELGNTMQAPSVCPPSMSPPFVHMLYMSGTSVHAATMLCSVSPCAAAQLTLLGLLNRLLRNHQLMTQIAQDILAGCHSLSSVLMVALYTFAGTLLQWPPPGTNVSSRLQAAPEGMTWLGLPVPSGLVISLVHRVSSTAGWRHMIAGMAFVYSSHLYCHLSWKRVLVQALLSFYSNNLNLFLDKIILSSKILDVKE